MAYQQPPPPNYSQAQGMPTAPPAYGFAPDQKQQYGYNQPAAYGQPQAYGQPGPYGQPQGGQGDTNMQSYPPPVPVVPRPIATTAGTDYPSDFGGSSFSDKAVRRAFIKKVYLILTAQLMVTVGFIALFVFVKPLKEYVQTHMWIYIVAYVTFLITYITLVCCPSVRKKSPGNFICLGVFTFAFSYMVGTISSFHDTNIVLLAAGITTAVCVSITIFAIQTKIDFTMCSGLLFALVMVLFFFGIACWITYAVWGYSRIMDSVYAGLGALVFALFLVYDTQQIVGGRKHELSPEEYINGALQLYMDIVYIFLFLLSLMGKNN